MEEMRGYRYSKAATYCCNVSILIETLDQTDVSGRADDLGQNNAIVGPNRIGHSTLLTIKRLSLALKNMIA